MFFFFKVFKHNWFEPGWKSLAENIARAKKKNSPMITVGHYLEAIQNVYQKKSLFFGYTKKEANPHCLVRWRCFLGPRNPSTHGTMECMKYKKLLNENLAAFLE